MSSRTLQWCYRRGGLAVFCVAAIAAALILFRVPSTVYASGWTAQPTARPVSALGDHSSDRLGAVASVSNTCSRIGIDVLQRGGNAADAAVAAQFCLGVVAPNLTGLGGGGFLLVRTNEGSYDFVDFRESAPAASSEDMFSSRIDDSLMGGLASGVPGELRGLEHLHKVYGSLPWAELLQPAIRLAQTGHIITKDFANAMDTYASSGFLINDPAWAVDFAPNGTRLGEGDLLTRKRLAALLESIAEKGADYFYTGSTASAITHALKAAGGIMTTKDLVDYTVTVRKPLQVDYRGYKITSCGAPSSGSVVLQVMKIVEGYSNFGASDFLELDTHRLDEAVRFGYGSRTLLGDPTFVSNVTAYEYKMIQNSTISEIRGRISDDHTLPVSEYNPLGLESIETPGTSHLSVVDAKGMAIALTSTVNLDFGSQLVVPELGIVMNNEMNDFSVPNSSNAFGYIPSPENFIQPGKRPQSSMSPTIVEFRNNNTLYFVVGADGGSRIITAVIQALWHVLDRGSTVLGAVGSPRFHDQLVPNQISFEYAYNNHTTDYMRSKGHNITWEGTGESDAHAIKRLPNGTFEAAGDPRLSSSGGYAV